jgi:NADH-quinone oxidoreductase subunit G
MACMTPAANGTRISVKDAQAAALRRGVIEWLMTNHPHDCPVCEEGGECHLQDMTVLSGHVYRRHRFPKRSFRNQDLGPCIGHEMNRCITCYRCVRFYRDHAGGEDLHALGIADGVYFGRHADGTLESPFSGNLVEVCPTGVFTDKPFGQRYLRKWDLMSAPSVCVHCGVGCNIQPAVRSGEYDGPLRRVMNRYNDAVNGDFICDRGRFGGDFVNAADRPRAVQRRGGPGPRPATAEDAIADLASRLREGRVIGVGSPRASLEANFLLRRLVGAEHFVAGVDAQEHRLLTKVLSILRDGPVPSADRRRIEASDAVLVLGEDVQATAPRLALSLRQAAGNAARRIAADKMVPPWQAVAVEQASGGARSPLFVLSTEATALDALAAQTLRGPPPTLARIGHAVARHLTGAEPLADLSTDAQALAEAIAEALAGAERPLVVSGIGCGSLQVLQAAAAIANALWSREQQDDTGPALRLALPECNSLGLALFEAPALETAFDALERGDADTLLVLENDLYRRAPAARVDAALARAERIVLLDHLHQPMAEKTHWLLPSAPFTETDATLVNDEGRAQRAYKVQPSAGDVQPAWRWLLAAADKAALPLPAGVGERGFDAVTAALAEELSAFAPLAGAAADPELHAAGLRIPRATPRASARTALSADREIQERHPPSDPDSPFRYSMEGGIAAPPAGLQPWYLAPRWTSNEALHRFQAEVPGPLREARQGVRLIEPAAAATPAAPPEPPPPYSPQPERWLVLPLHSVFGSEEQSARAPALQARAPAPYLALHPDDADELGLRDDTEAELRLDGQALRLPVQRHADLVRGTAGVPIGLPGLTGLELPAYGGIAPAEEKSRDDIEALGNRSANERQ